MWNYEFAFLPQIYQSIKFLGHIFIASVIVVKYLLMETLMSCYFLCSLFLVILKDKYSKYSLFLNSDQQ